MMIIFEKLAVKRVVAIDVLNLRSSDSLNFLRVLKDSVVFISLNYLFIDIKLEVWTVFVLIVEYLLRYNVDYN